MFTIQNRQLIFLLSAIGLIVAPHIMQLPSLLFGFFAFLWSWRFLGIWQPQWLPNKLLVFLLMLTGVGLLFLQYRGFIFGRDAGTGLFITALGLKLLEIRTPRDVYLIAYLAFIVAATQFLYSQNVFMVIYILAVSSVLLCTMISLNDVTTKTRDSLKIAFTIVLQALPITAVLFIFFPRLEPPHWTFLDKPKSSSGISDTLKLDSMNELALSYELAFRVKFSGEIPSPSERYWRGPVFTKTDGINWMQSEHTHFGRFMDKPIFSGKPYQYTLLMESQTKNWVFALDMPAQFDVTLSKNVNHQLITNRDFSQRAEYKITSYPNYNTGYITRTEYNDALQLYAPPSDFLVNLVKQLNGFNSLPTVFIENVFAYFKNENFAYTLRPPRFNQNPIEAFLQEKRGFCSHYATAFVYLMRIAHIPARVVAGYQGGELNQVGDFLEIRQANAHAWTEVWIEKQGWVRFDPTTAIAPERVEHEVDIAQQIERQDVNLPVMPLSEQQLNWLKKARHLWQNVDYSWQRWVINYNTQNQLKFLLYFGIKNLEKMVFALLYFTALVIAISAWFLLRKQRQNVDKSVVIYQKFCKKCIKLGLIKQPTEGAHDFALKIVALRPELAAPVQNITDRFIHIRYGKKSTPDDLKKFKQFVNQFHL